MNRPWEEALRSLARRTQGPFRVLAYGVTAAAEETPIRTSELAILLSEQGFESGSETRVEIADAPVRPSFPAPVLEWIECLSRPIFENRPEHNGLSTEEARRRLQALTAHLDEFLDGTSPAPTPVGFGPRAAPAPLVLFGRLEDLGSDAEGIASAVEAMLVRGAHLLIPSEGIDTRTREGRGRAALLVRLGGIKAAIARERSLKELGRRRQGLEVYGPVPFGFERQGSRLVPVDAQRDTVERIRELANRGVTLFEIAMVLNREQRRWKDGTSWTGRRVNLVLRNPIHDHFRREDIA